jgi:hypothetical protein
MASGEGGVKESNPSVPIHRSEGMAQQKIADLGMLGTPNDPAAQRLLTRRPRDGDRLGMVGRLAPSHHAITLDVTYRDRAYRVTAIKVQAEDGDELTSGDLGLPVKEAAERLLQQLWTYGEAWVGHAASVEDAFAQIDAERGAEFRQRQRRRWLTDAHLRDVADVYGDAERAGASSLVRAVAERFGCSLSTAERWIRTARERGFLPQSPRQKGR